LDGNAEALQEEAGGTLLLRYLSDPPPNLFSRLERFLGPYSRCLHSNGIEGVVWRLCVVVILTSSDVVAESTSVANSAAAITMFFSQYMELANLVAKLLSA